MALSSELISQLVKAANERPDGNNDNVIYGTIVEDGGNLYLKFDGSSELTPAYSTAEIADGDRVTATIRDHTAIITGNLTDPSIGGKRADGIERKIEETETGIRLSVEDTLNGVRSELEIASDQISSKVTAATDAAANAQDNANAVAEAYSEVVQTANSISSKVAEVDVMVGNANGILDEIKIKESSINQTATGISLKVTEASGYAADAKGYADGASAALADVTKKQSEINQTASSISMRVTEVKESADKAADSASAAANSANGANYSANEAAKSASDASSSASSAYTSYVWSDEARRKAEECADEVEKYSDFYQTVDGFFFTTDKGQTFMDGANIHLGGLLNLYERPYSTTIGGYIGYDSGFNSSTGVGMKHYNGSTQCVCTNNAARLSYENNTSVVCSESYLYLDGDVIKFELSGSDRFTMADHGTYCSFRPSGTGYTYTLGTSNVPWDNLYSDACTCCTSDANKKHDIENLPDKYITLLDNLKPKRFKLNNGTSGRYHVGYIAQEVEEAMAVAGIDRTEFGGFVKDVDENGTEIYMLRYEEFNGIYDMKLKQLEAKYEAKINDLEVRLERLEKLLG